MRDQFQPLISLSSLSLSLLSFIQLENYSFIHTQHIYISNWILLTSSSSFNTFQSQKLLERKKEGRESKLMTRQKEKFWICIQINFSFTWSELFFLPSTVTFNLVSNLVSDQVILSIKSYFLSSRILYLVSFCILSHFVSCFTQRKVEKESSWSFSFQKCSLSSNPSKMWSNLIQHVSIMKCFVFITKWPWSSWLLLVSWSRGKNISVIPLIVSKFRNKFESNFWTLTAGSIQHSPFHLLKGKWSDLKYLILALTILGVLPDMTECITSTTSGYALPFSSKESLFTSLDICGNFGKEEGSRTSFRIYTILSWQEKRKSSKYLFSTSTCCFVSKRIKYILQNSFFVNVSIWSTLFCKSISSINSLEENFLPMDGMFWNIQNKVMKLELILWFESFPGWPSVLFISSDLRVICNDTILFVSFLSTSSMRKSTSSSGSGSSSSSSSLVSLSSFDFLRSSFHEYGTCYSRLDLGSRIDMFWTTSSLNSLPQIGSWSIYSARTLTLSTSRT